MPTTQPLAVRDASGAGVTLTATGLVARDAAGKVRVAAGLDADRFPSIDLYDASGTIRESAYLVDDRPVFRQFDKAGKRRAELFLAGDTENGEDVIRDASEVTRLAVFRGPLGLPEIGFYGSDGKVRAYRSTDDDVPYLGIKDRAAATRVVMGGYASGKMGMDLRNAGGTAIWSRP
jgi:hypothetical protein